MAGRVSKAALGVMQKKMFKAEQDLQDEIQNLLECESELKDTKDELKHCQDELKRCKAEKKKRAAFVLKQLGEINARDKIIDDLKQENKALHTRIAEMKEDASLLHRTFRDTRDRLEGTINQLKKEFQQAVEQEVRRVLAARS
jgi:chromosome segregation ATPase